MKSSCPGYLGRGSGNCYHCLLKSSLVHWGLFCGSQLRCVGSIPNSSQWTVILMAGMPVSLESTWFRRLRLSRYSHVCTVMLILCELSNALRNRCLEGEVAQLTASEWKAPRHFYWVFGSLCPKCFSCLPAYWSVIFLLHTTEAPVFEVHYCSKCQSRSFCVQKVRTWFASCTVPLCKFKGAVKTKYNNVLLERTTAVTQSAPF